MAEMAGAFSHPGLLVRLSEMSDRNQTCQPGRATPHSDVQPGLTTRQTTFSGHVNVPLSGHAINKFQRLAVLQLNIEGLTASKMNVLGCPENNGHFRKTVLKLNFMSHEPPKHFSKPKFHQQKIMVTVWWCAIGVIHYSFLDANQSITAEVYCNQLEEMHHHLQKMRPALVNRRGPILLHDNARPHVARMTLQKLTDLGYETLPHPPYSPDLSLTDYHLFKHLAAFLSNKTFRSNAEVESFFKDFLASKPKDFYQRGINDLVDRWQRCMAVQGSYFD